MIDGTSSTIIGISKRQSVAATSRKSIAVAAAVVIVGLAILGSWQAEFFSNSHGNIFPQLALGDEDGPILSLPKGPSIAVLPFDNLTGDPEQDYFVDGIAEELITALTRFQDLFVLARNTSFQYKGKSVDVKTIGEQLNVRYLLEGSVRSDTREIRIAAQLIDAKTASHIWAETFRSELTASNLFDIQDELTAKIVGAVGGSDGSIVRSRVQAIRTSRTESLDAYECLLRAHQYHWQHTPEQHRIARDCLERAIELDPNYVEALAELAYIYLEENRHDWNRRPSSIERGLEMALRALELDDNNQAARWGAANAYYSQGKMDRFYSEAQRAIEINPNNPAIIGYLAHYMIPTGKWEEGVALMKKAMALNPKHPTWYHVGIFYDQFRRGDYNAALESMLRAGADPHSVLFK